MLRSMGLRINGAAVKAIREAKHISLGTFAALIPVASSTMSNYEADRRQPDPETRRRIADALSVPLAAITNGERDEVAA